MVPHEEDGHLARVERGTKYGKGYERDGVKNETRRECSEARSMLHVERDDICGGTRNRDVMIRPEDLNNATRKYVESQR